MHYILESTFAGIFLFLELILQQETHIYNNLRQFANLHTLFLLFLSLFHNNFILIGHSKQCVQSRRTRGVLKIERYEQRLTHRACFGNASSYSLAPAFLYIPAPNVLKTNRPALAEASFVKEAIQILLELNCIAELSVLPEIVNPLSVSIQKSSKKRLILDLNILICISSITYSNVKTSLLPKR